MRISELSSHTEIPVATIKFYLRENLLHDGARPRPLRLNTTRATWRDSG